MPKSLNETDLIGKLFIDKKRDGSRKEVATVDMLPGSGNPTPAEDVSFDPGSSGLTATDVQAAIVELKAIIDNL